MEHSLRINNFVIKEPPNKKIEFITRNTGSNNLYTTFSSLGGRQKKFSYYTYYNYKKETALEITPSLNQTTFIYTLL